MRIALLTYSTQPRGSVVHTLELAAALTVLGHEAWVYGLDKDGQGFGRSRPHPVQPVPAGPAPPTLDALIHQRIQEFVDFFLAHPTDFDIYHGQDCIAANALVQLRQGGHIPPVVVRTVHHVEDYTSPYLQDCQERSIREPNLCLCVSDRWHQVLRTTYGLPAQRVVNGVDTHRFSPQPCGQEVSLKARYGLTGSPRFLTVGGIEPRKNSLRLLQAFAQGQVDWPQGQLIIAGGATLFDYQAYRQDFFALVDTLGLTLGQQVILPGVVPAADLPALYRCADGFCFPSVKEGWGLVLLEAIASGLPILTADRAPFTEFLTPDQAVLVDPDSVTAIAHGMLTLLDRHAPTRVARSQTLLPQYTWQRSAQAHLQHYQALRNSTLES